jgi:hypothetical protein
VSTLVAARCSWNTVDEGGSGAAHAADHIGEAGWHLLGFAHADAQMIMDTLSGHGDGAGRVGSVVFGWWRHVDAELNGFA